MREFDLINTYRKVLRHQSGSVFAGVHASIDSIISALEKKCPEILNGPKSDRRPEYTVLDALNSIKNM